MEEIKKTHLVDQVETTRMGTSADIVGDGSAAWSSARSCLRAELDDCDGEGDAGRLAPNLHAPVGRPASATAPATTEPATVEAWPSTAAAPSTGEGAGGPLLARPPKVGETIEP